MIPQRSIAHYRIVDKIGEGGMGAVYRAHDTKLGRDVAIKVLPPALANDADYIARFQREAQVLASLNHPNIAAIYGLEENAIVMELLEGAELRGPLPLDEAMRVAKQIADALEAAHERGVVHRDLKPANIKIAADGTVKVLDFGLAKAIEPIGTGASAVNSPTLTIHATTAGVILGTAAYMSPEQARGQAVDRRADIWAFGVVLWEMITGRQMFEGETVSDVLAAVLRTEPDLAAVPREIRPVIAACLEKNPRQRLRDVGDWSRLIAAAEARPAQPSRSFAPWAVAVAAVTLTALMAVWTLRRPVELKRSFTLEAQFGDQNTVLGPRYPGHLFAISPDGSKLAFMTDDPSAGSAMSMALRDLTTREFKILPGTDGAHTPFFSPDGDSIAFWADGKLRKLRLEGGTQSIVCDMPQALRGGVWTTDDQLIVAPHAGPLLRVPASGGKLVPITEMAPGEMRQRQPQLLPGSDTVIFTASGDTPDSPPNVWALSLKSGRRKLLEQDAAFGSELPTGHILLLKQRTLYAAKFDSQALALQGKPVPVVQGVHFNAPGGAIASLSREGTLVYSRSAQQGSFRLFRVGRDRLPEPLPGTRFPGYPNISTDGKRVAFYRDQAVWVYDIQRRTEFRLTPPGSTAGVNMQWTANGSHLVYQTPEGMMWVRSDGSSRPERLSANPDDAPAGFSPDGRTLLIMRRKRGLPPTAANLYTAAFSQESAQPMATPNLFLDAGFTAFGASFSPDGRWVLYHSQEDGSSKVYVRPYPGPGPRVQISTGWGEQPRWSRGKNEILYHGGDRRVMVVPWKTEGGTLVPGEAKPWAEIRAFELGGNRTFDVMPDGEAVLVGGSLDKGGSAFSGGETHLVFMLNFFDEVKRRVP